MKDMNKGGRSRADKNRQIRQDGLREKLKGSEYLRQIHLILGRKDIDSKEVPILKMRLGGYFGLLRKILPDLAHTQVDVTKTDITYEDRLHALDQEIPIHEYMERKRSGLLDVTHH